LQYKFIAMTHSYTIEGMTCKSCVAKVKSSLVSTAGIESADVQLEKPQATIVMHKHMPLEELQAAVNKAGNYTITADDDRMPVASSWLHTYKPVLLIFFYVFLVTLVIQGFGGSFNLLVWMQHFMAGFFLVFSFFKMLDIEAFANSYAMYDIVAKRWKAWGYIYPFAELGLGLAYLVAPQYALTSIVTLGIMLVSIVGVLQSVLNKRAIQCACLGAVFNLPMSTVTVIEDGLMVGMSIAMLATMI
jgi:copper chaperone CopZ